MSESESPKPQSTDATKSEMDPILTACLFAGLSCEALDMAAQHASNITEGAHAHVVEAFMRYMQARGCFEPSGEATQDTNR